MMKYLFVIIVLILSVIINAQNSSRFLEVTGTHQLNIEANQIVLSINVKTIDEGLEKSKNRNSELADILLSNLKGYSNTKNDIELTPISFGINYKLEDRKSVEDGFYTSQQIKYTLNDLSKYYDLIDYLIKIENVEIVGSYYNNSNYEEYNKQAYENAVIAAKEKADYLSKKANINLGDVLELEDNSERRQYMMQNYPNPFNTVTSSSRTSEIMGSLSIKRSVRMKFEIIK